MEKIAASIAQIAAEAEMKAHTEARCPAPDLPGPILSGLQAWIADQPEPQPTMPDAIRHGLTAWLSGLGYLPAVPREET